MLPNATGGLNDIMFPMTADIYYADTKQLDYGNVAKTWVFDRTVDCSVISELSNRGFIGELTTKGQDLVYDSNAFFRTKEDLRKKSNGSYMPITAIAITNIKDPAGNDVWINGQNLSNAAGAIKTKYEIKTISIITKRYKIIK
jgi:hypothetical protein